MDTKLIARLDRKIARGAKLGPLRNALARKLGLPEIECEPLHVAAPRPPRRHTADQYIMPWMRAQFAWQYKRTGEGKLSGRRP